jgi:hypothetical protein
MSKGAIQFTRSEATVNMVITLFAIIQNEGHNKEIKINGNNITIRERAPEEINKLNSDTHALQGKLLGMFHNPTPFLTLTDAESDLFRDCVHAAYYWMTEKEGDKANEHPFMKHYIEMKGAGIL